LYETVVRVYLKPSLGHYGLRRLSVPIVQQFLNAKLAEGKSVRNVHMMRQVLSAALTRAAREELISRNVARLAELPAWEPADVRPSSADEALAFLRAAKDDLLYPAFVLPILFGMRRDAAGSTFTVLRRQLGWTAAGRTRAPRIHDLRHRMVVRRIQAWHAWSVHPTWHCTNPNVQVDGIPFAVGPVHAKIRRDGYRM
jgi:hypothetical protein